MAYRNNKNQGGFIALILLLLVLLFRDKLPQYINNLFKDCACDNDNTISIPEQSDFKAQNKEVIVDRELYERSNDKDVLKLPQSIIKSQILDGGLIKFSENAIIT